MFPFHCSQCSRNSMSAGRPRCLQCDYAEPKTTVDDDFNPTEPEAPRQFGTASGSKNHLLPNDMQMVEQVSTHDRKRKEEMDQMIPDICEGHFEASKGKRIRHVDDIRAVPSPSGLNQNKDTSNLSEEKSQSRSSLEQLSGALIDEKTWICDICKWDIGKHYEAHDRTIFYKCCVCFYESSSKRELQKHASIHRPDYSRCNICGEFDFQKNAHGREENCEVCNEKFQCRTLLEEHFLVHEKYHLSKCRLCRRKVNYHLVIDSKRKFYKCCECPHETNLKYNLQIHLYGHRDLRLFKCEICGRRSKKNCNRIVHLRSHFKCKICGDLFTSTEDLEEHFKQAHARA